MADNTIASVLHIPYESFTSNQEFVSYYQNTLAPFLLNQVEVIINNVRHKLREIEFYFTSEQHDDPFTHCDKIQEQDALWYFHKMGSGYKGGSYKGLDITIGRGKEAAGGILIRSIECIEGVKKFVCGPSLCVDHIIDTCGADTIANLVDDHFKGDISVLETNSHKLLYLKLQDEASSLPVYHTPRIGLHMTKKDVDPSLQRDYVFRCYRSISAPTEISKGKNLTICALYDSGKTLNEICDIMSSKMSVVTSTVEVFKNGYDSKNWKEFLNTRPSDKEVCRAYGAVQKSLKKSGSNEENNNNDDDDDSEKKEEQEEKDENDNGNEEKEKPKSKRNTRSKKMVVEKSEEEEESTEKDFNSMLVAELKSECKKRGLPVSGTKAVLVSRLLESSK